MTIHPPPKQSSYPNLCGEVTVGQAEKCNLAIPKEAREKRTLEELTLSEDGTLLDSNGKIVKPARFTYPTVFSRHDVDHSFAPDWANAYLPRSSIYIGGVASNPYVNPMHSIEIIQYYEIEKSS